MFCRNCGTQLDASVQYCSACGTAVSEATTPVEAPAAAPTSIPYAPPAAPVIPPEYRPLGAWAYFGLSVLFSVPIVGFIFLIIFSFNGSNINRRSYARSYWCALLILVIAATVIFGFAAVTGAVIGSSYYFY